MGILQIEAHLKKAFIMNSLYYGDNIKVLRNSISTETVDLIYLDPPFNNQATHHHQKSLISDWEII